MRTRTLMRLLALASGLFALWLAIAFIPWGSTDESGEVSDEWGEFFTRLNRVTTSAVRFDGPGASRELVKSGGDWTVDGFPSDSGMVARFWQAVEDAEVTSLVARNPENHARMGLSADSAFSVDFEVDGETRTVLVGHPGASFGTSFVRRPDDDAVYVLSENLRTHFTRSLSDWRDKRIVMVDTARVHRVEVAAGADTYELIRADSTWTLSDGNEVSSIAATGLLEELSTLRANGFVEEGDSLRAVPASMSVTALTEAGDTLAALALGGESGERWTTTRGNEAVYRLPSFRVDRLVPSRERLEAP